MELRDRLPRRVWFLIAVLAVAAVWFAVYVIQTMGAEPVGSFVCSDPPGPLTNESVAGC